MTKTIRVGTGEKMQYLVHEYNDNTVRFLLRYPGRIDPLILEKAVLAVVTGVDILHASFTPGKITAKWTISEEQPECFIYEKTDSDPFETALRFALEPIGAAEPVKMRCILAEGKSECALVLLVSHLCADGSDAKYLLAKLAETYNMIKARGSAASLHIKNGSRSVRQIYKKLGLSQKMALLRDPRSGVKSVFPFADPAPGRPVLIAQRIPDALLSAARERAKQTGATVNDLLLCACYRAFAAVPGMEAGASIAFTSMMDLRRHCPGGDSAGLSNLSGMLSTSLPNGISGTFADTLSDLSAQTKHAKEDPLAGLYGMPLLHGAINTCPCALLEAVATRIYGSLAVGLTNLGRISPDSLAMGGVSPSECLFGGPLKNKPGVQVSALSLGGCCALAVVGSYTQADESLLRSFLGMIRSELEEYALGTDAASAPVRRCL